MKPVNLIAGTKIVLTKKEIKRGQKSAFKKGEKRSGTLYSDCKKGRPVRLEERDGRHVTSEIISLKKSKREILLETETSIYSVRVVKDKEDAEFKKWLHW